MSSENLEIHFNLILRVVLFEMLSLNSSWGKIAWSDRGSYEVYLHWCFFCLNICSQIWWKREIILFIGEENRNTSVCCTNWMVSSNNIEFQYLQCRGFSKVFEVSAIITFFSFKTTCSSFKYYRMPLPFHKNMEKGCKLFVGIINDCSEKWYKWVY